MIASKKRTKILCTIGPASDSPAKIEKLIRAGMNVARLNFSHNVHSYHKRVLGRVRSIGRKLGVQVAVFADLQGPKVRVGNLPEEGIKLVGEVTFRIGTEKYENGIIPVPYKGLARDLKKDDVILLDDGILEVKVLSIKRDLIHTKVVVGGKLTSHKGFNVPTASLHIPAFTAKDKEDLEFAVRTGVDAVALSFVKTADDVKKVRQLLDKLGHSKIKIISKIEKHEAIKNFDAILKVTDGIMVARGDLGIEIPAEEVPILQKEIIRKCLVSGKFVIVATQMLDSMIHNPRPTRAEASDVANGVIDHTDAEMLSGETATGKYPVQAVQYMTKIICEAEDSHYDDLTHEEIISHAASGGEAMAEVAGLLSNTPHIDGIVVTTISGESARQIVRFRPELPLIACTPDPIVARQLSFSWGVVPVVISNPRDSASLEKIALRAVLKNRLLKKGSKVLFVTGTPIGKPGRTNKVEIITL